MIAKFRIESLLNSLAICDVFDSGQYEPPLYKKAYVFFKYIVENIEENEIF